MQIGGKNKELLGVFREGLQLIVGNGNRTISMEVSTLTVGAGGGAGAVELPAKAYLNQQGQGVGVLDSSSFSKLWKGPTPPRVKLLCWFVMHEILNTRERLLSCGVVPQPECMLCGKLPESVHHLFFGCEHAWKVWSFVLKEFNVMWGWPGESLKCFESWFGRNVRNNYKERWVRCFLLSFGAYGKVEIR
ncbi:hypothetical protein Ahy_A10g047927 [Arachis hypogaea]|uniref:Reverse transcriptase zinc-binding domain-containing protein n=1 Tax=Arachis hypogaea TaxID=3818 RepID=A0A445B3S7_ARAHY|nr:hypothetical protein Ahy_A10g047927 [Arachis hypogaea]